jgi:anaerobic magnesium-protoporphyrin IX monomethyl ester cyclase
MTRVLLTHSFYLCHDRKQEQRMKPYPPLATLVAAAVARRAGYEVHLFDAMLSSGVDEFDAELHAVQPDVVAVLEDNFNYVTKMCTTTMRAAGTGMVASAAAAGAQVVVNGSDASDVPAAYLQAGADAVIVGETERALPEVLAALVAGRDLHGIDGLVLPDGRGGFVRNRPRPPLDDLDSLPLPAWDLLDRERYRAAWRGAHGRLSWNMVASRGCPLQCAWCAKPLYGDHYALRGTNAVAEEMERLQAEVGPDHIWFADDIFGLRPGWIVELADELEHRGVRIPFTVQSRVDLMTPEVCSALARAGAEEVWLGVESGAQSVLDGMNKGTTVEQAQSATRELRRCGVRPSWFLQLGFPNEGWADILATRDLVRELEPHDVGVSVCYPLPGTAFYEQVASQLGGRANWTDSSDLAMLFNGPFPTAIYRRVRDLLHEEAEVARRSPDERSAHRARLDRKWLELEQDAGTRGATAPG